jgi:hypothetical protein
MVLRGRYVCLVNLGVTPVAEVFYLAEPRIGRRWFTRKKAA